ncbi:Poly(A)-specific ribonuclease PARN [Blattella germanica]|nr:Poly(A)-specific ribonuclease PARN [Blattella germanica]
MEVTRKNFREVLEELEHVIPPADFLAIDGEFTGIHSRQEVNPFDTPSQYYSKIRSGNMEFLLVQFGLCVFNYDKDNDKYTHRAYNFYIFPKTLNCSISYPRFMCQSSSIEFLSSQGFDFNKLFREGIPYLTQSEEQKLRENLEEKHKSRSTTNKSPPTNDEETPLIPIPEEHVKIWPSSRIEKFLESSEPEELELDRCNAFIRKLIFQEVQQRFDSNKVFIESRVVENRNRVLVVSRNGTQELREQKEKEKRDKELQELEDAVGFTTVVKKISESGKLVIGHNMLLDICHMVHQFCHPLPENYSEFKQLVNCLFPKLLDTKFMSQSPVFKESISSNVLEHMYKILSEKPFTMCIAEPDGDGMGYSSVSEKYHEAGYDAYITGLCFITMSNHIAKNEAIHKGSTRPDFEITLLVRLFLMRVQDCPYIDLAGQDPVPPRGHVFFISFPKEWKTSDIIQLFSPFGSVFIGWINETSAYVALYKRDQAGLVKKTLTQSDSYTVMTYAAHQRLLAGRTKCRCASSGGKTLCAECIKYRQELSVPRSRKRQIEESVQDLPVKQRRSRSFGDCITVMLGSSQLVVLMVLLAFAAYVFTENWMAG